MAVNRHDLSVINIYDPRDRELPNIGLVRVSDAESGAQKWINTSSREVRESYRRWNEKLLAESVKLFNKFKVDNVSIGTDQDYVRGLITFFKSR